MSLHSRFSKFNDISASQHKRKSNKRNPIKTMNNQKTYLFDFDGTLVDSMPAFVSLMQRILNEYGMECDEDMVKIITPLGYGGTAEYFCSLGIRSTKDELVKLMNEYARDDYLYNIPQKSGTVKTLTEMKKRGKCLNVLTASPHTVLDPCLKRLGLFELFDNVWSCDDFETTKTDPEIYKMAAKRLNTDIENIVFVDDNVNAVKTARLCGMKSYGIYDSSSKDYIEQMKTVSDRYIYELSELLDE